MGKSKKSPAWAEAKKRCRLNQADIQMAKELGMTPKSLLKNIPSPKQQWKAPVKVWVRDLYEKKFGRALTIDKDKSNKDQAANSEVRKGNLSRKTQEFSDEELPF